MSENAPDMIDETAKIGGAPPQIAPAPAKRKLNPGLKLVLEMGPLALFFMPYAFPQVFSPILSPFLPGWFFTDPNGGLYIGTVVFIIATVVALTVHFALVGRLPIMPIVSGIVVLVFGGLTIYLRDPVFIKMKPTVIDAMFGLILLGGLAFGKSLINVVLDSAVDLTDEGWRKLTLRWGVFFLVLALINEIVWRNFSTGWWLSYKAVGSTVLTVIFAMSQMPLLMRHEVKKDPAE